MGLPGIWVLVAVIIGGGVAGVLGMLFGVPLVAAIYRIVRHDLRKFESAKGAQEPSAVPCTDAPTAAPTQPEPKAPKTKKKKS